MMTFPKWRTGRGFDLDIQVLVAFHLSRLFIKMYNLYIKSTV